MSGFNQGGGYQRNGGGYQGGGSYQGNGGYNGNFNGGFQNSNMGMGNNMGQPPMGNGGMQGGQPNGPKVLQPIMLQEGYEIVKKSTHGPICRAFLTIGSVITFARNVVFNIIFLLMLGVFLIGYAGFSAMKDSFENWANGNVQHYANLVPASEVLCLDLKGSISEMPFDSSSFANLQREIEYSLYGRKNHELLAIEKALNLVHHDPQIKKVLIKLDGLKDVSLSVAERIGQAMEYAKAKGTSNPHEVIVVGTNFSQSAYAIAAHADRVILDPLGEIDFKGLSLSSLFVKDLLEKANVTPYIFRAGHFKSAVEPFMLNGMSYDVKKEYEAIAFKSWSLYKDLILNRSKIKNKDVLPDAQTYISWLQRFKGDRANLQLAEGFVDEVVPLEKFYRTLSQEVVADGDDPSRPALITYQDYLMRYYVNTSDGTSSAGSLGSIPVPPKSASLDNQGVEVNLPTVAELTKSTTANLQALSKEQIDLQLREFYNSTAKMIPDSKKRIEVIYGIGQIVDFTENPNDFTPDNIVPLLDRARLDDDVLGVILYLNSPGGSVNASEKIRRAVEEFQLTNKPIFVSMNGTAASGAYWIACQSDQIFATKTTITGSIGVFGLSFGVHKLLNNFGAYQDGVSTNELAQPAIGKVLPESQQMLLSLNVESTYKDFLELVAGNRNLDILAYPRYAEGQIFLADDARKLNLIDHVGTLQDTINALQLTLMENPKLKLKNKVAVKHVTPSMAMELTGLESLFFGLSAKYLPDEITSALIELKQQSKLVKGAANEQAVLAISPIAEPKL